MGAVCVSPFWCAFTLGYICPAQERIEEKIGFYDNPKRRFEGKDTQQETFFVEDPKL